MRAVALSDKAVQKKVREFFVPLKITIEPGTAEFPVDWPGLHGWAGVYQVMGGSQCEGITACSVVTPDLQAEYGSTGSALVWEMFDSIAYDAQKFASMLDRACARHTEEKCLRKEYRSDPAELEEQLAAFRADVAEEIQREGALRLPPRGFSIDRAKQLFRLTGDLVDGVAPPPKPEAKKDSTKPPSDSGERSKTGNS